MGEKERTVLLADVGVVLVWGDGEGFLVVFGEDGEGFCWPGCGGVV